MIFFSQNLDFIFYKHGQVSLKSNYYPLYFVHIVNFSQEIVCQGTELFLSFPMCKL